MKNEEYKVDKAFLDKQARASYERILKEPDDWVYTAVLLRRAAEEIDTFALPGRGFSNHTQNDKDTELYSLIGVYRFLIGMSFENLLKAVAIWHGKKIESNMFTHKINDLIDQIDASRLNLTDEEKGILIELEEYVLWEGRYPIPKKADKHKIVHGFSSEQHRKERALWERLFKHVNECPSVKVEQRPDSVYKNIIRRWGLL